MLNNNDIKLDIFKQYIYNYYVYFYILILKFINIFVSDNIREIMAIIKETRHDNIKSFI